jgi:23S rRNA (adenine2030-N6)-methyltransferase
MNYRHAFHAGNHADVLKHTALIWCLARLKQKPAPFAVLDSHAGPGLYDLASDEARRSPEWRGGIARLWGTHALPPALHAYREAVAGFNEDGELRFYPGSPALIAKALRPDDRLLACELHPEDASSLKQLLRSDRGAHIHARDGWEALGALLPFPERRGLVLIDPPYEETDELARAAQAFGPALKRFGHGVFIWWRPMKTQSALKAADREVAAQCMQNSGAREMLRADLWIDAPQREGKLTGSSLLIVNPPFGLAAALREALPVATELLRAGAAGWRVQNLS